MRARRPPATPVKRKLRFTRSSDDVIRRVKKPVRPLVYSDDDEDVTDVYKPVPPLVYSDDDEDVTDVSKHKTPSAFIRRIWAVKSRQEPHVAATAIKEALRVGEKYDVMDIQEINTCFGPRQVWSLKGVGNNSLKKVFGCSDLQQFTTDAEGYLDQQYRRDMIANVRVTYKGILENRNDAYPKYDFDYRQR